LPHCRIRCKQKLGEERKNNFTESWLSPLGRLRSSYGILFAPVMTMTDKASSNPSFDNQKSKNCRNVEIYYPEIDKQGISICRFCFLKTLHESDNFIKLVTLKKRVSTGCLPTANTCGLTFPLQKPEARRSVSYQTIIRHVAAADGNPNRIARSLYKYMYRIYLLMLPMFTILTIVGIRIKTLPLLLFSV
jgi:hypothetical protein